MICVSSSLLFQGLVHFLLQSDFKIQYKKNEKKKVDEDEKSKNMTEKS